MIFTTVGHWRNDCQQMAPSVSQQQQQQQPELLQQWELQSHLHIYLSFILLNHQTEHLTDILLGIKNSPSPLCLKSSILHLTFNLCLFLCLLVCL